MDTEHDTMILVAADVSTAHSQTLFPTKTSPHSGLIYRPVLGGDSQNPLMALSKKQSPCVNMLERHNYRVKVGKKVISESS